MSLSIRFTALGAVMGLLAMPALAQSNFQCVNGELLGGPQGFACETDSNGSIINVQPRAFTETAPQARPTPTPAPRTVQGGTTVYRGSTPTYVPHRPAPHPYTPPQTTTRTVTRTYSHQPHPAPVTRTYTYTQSYAPVTYRTAPQPAPVTRTYAPAQRPFHPILITCDAEVTRLRDTRDGRPRYEVCYSDLRPIRYPAAEILYDRISIAAKKACRGGHITGSLISRDRTCRREAIKQAVFDVNSPALDAVYADKTGRAIPRVRVGRPIYR